MIANARAALMCVYICKLFHDYGKLDRLDTRSLVDPDNWYDLVCEGVQSCCELAEFGGDEFEAKIYFSDSSMLAYYKLCRDYCQSYGVSLKDNPFMKKADEYVNRLMYYHISGDRYGWTLHTRINHACASGVLFAYSSDYFNYHELLELCEVMLEICRFYETELVALREAVNIRKNQSIEKEAA